MEDGSLYPSIYEKILGQPCLFIRNFHKTQASNSIPATLAFFNGVLHSYLGPPHQGSASPTVTPMPSKSVGVPSKKGNDIGPVFRSLLWVTAMMTTAPANRVMILMRCQNEMIKSGRLSHPFKGIGDCFARTVRNEGIISLWKGNTAHMMGLITKKLTSLAVALFLVYPLEYAKTRIANDIRTKSTVEKRQYNGMIDVFRKTLKSDGIDGLYHGYKMAYVAYFVHNVLFFVLKPKGMLEMLGFQYTMPTTIILGAGTPLLADLITYPLHTVVQRKMMRSGEAVKYKSSIDAFSQILKNEGVRSLYKGASAQIIKSVVISGIAMMF
ncbi:hypothetical protein Q3G72_021626 [Acer saccharum]|nr:hypothetical protein Q3G72_021626 [Acer saccharum]